MRFCRLPLVYHAICLAQGRSTRWPAVRREYLKKNPACEVTGIAEDPEVHHIVPFHERPDLELDPRNLITLTNKKISVHELFGHLLNWKSKNPSVGSDAFSFLRKIINRP